MCWCFNDGGGALCLNLSPVCICNTDDVCFQVRFIGEFKFSLYYPYYYEHNDASNTLILLFFCFIYIFVTFLDLRRYRSRIAC